MFRLKAGLVIGGAFLMVFGVRDVWMNIGVSSTPVAVDLATLEGGGKVEDENVIIGRHIALYPHAAIQTKGESTFGDAPISLCFYPIMADDGGSLEDVPLGNIAVLVKTYKYKYISEIPPMAVRRDSMQGLVINDIAALSKDMKEEVAKQYPTLDFDKVLLVEEDRHPTVLWGVLMLLGGAATSGAGAALFLLLKT